MENFKQQTTAPKSADTLRVEMQSIIDVARNRFEKGADFNPECFSTLMMAYRYAIETQDCKGD